MADVQPRVSRTAVDIALVLHLTVGTDSPFLLILLFFLLDGLFFLFLTFLLDLAVAHLPCEEAVEEESHGVQCSYLLAAIALLAMLNILSVAFEAFVGLPVFGT